MVAREIISKSITDAIFKCNSSSKARKIGETCQVSHPLDKYDKPNLTKYSYDNGVSITFDRDYNIVDVTGENSEIFNYYGDDAYDKFDYIKELLLTTNDGEVMSDFQKDVLELDSDWDMLLEYVNDFASGIGWEYNTDLRQGINDEDNRENLVWLYHEWFVNLEKTIPIDKDNYACLRITSKIHENEDLSKLVVKDKAHVCATVGTNIDKILDNFGFKDYYDVIDESIGNFEKSWKTIILVPKNSGVTGLFFGTAINEGRYADADFLQDWEAEVNFAPNQKFKRLVIDEANRIIVQVPDGIGRG